MNAYDFSFSRANGETLKLADFKGKVLLVVNTASKCGFTRQYIGLQELYEKYAEYGLILIAVPSNDFGGQEPGDDAQIVEFCNTHYSLTFPLVNKAVVSGAKAHPFYVWAKKELGFGTAPKWNFHKYLIDRRGSLVDYFYSTTLPQSVKVIRAIKELLKSPEI